MTSYWDLYIAYVRECEKLNQANSIDPHHYEMEWNHTLPRCLFGDLPFGQFLTLKQHAIASCLQTLAFQKVCFCGFHQKFVPEWLWKQAQTATLSERQNRVKDIFTHEERVEMGRKGGAIVVEKKLGIHGAPPEQKSEWNARGGNKSKEMGVGIHSATSEQLSEWSQRNNGKTGRMMKEESRGIFAPGMQVLGGKTTQQLGVGLFALTKEQLQEAGRKTTSQRWKCLVTEHISTPGGLSRWQKARGIDTSLREKIV